MVARILCVVFTMLIVSACSDVKLQQELDAEMKVDALFSVLLKGHYGEALSHYDEGFFVRTSPEQWQAHLEQVQSQLGKMHSYSLQKKQTDTRYSGRFFILEYQVEYEKGRSWETLTLFISIDDETMKLLGHKIDAPGVTSFSSR